MLILQIAAFAVGLAQEPATKTEPDVAVISARLGPCAADFTVTDADGTGIYAATIHVRIRYGFLGIKRMDLEVGTNGDGRARVEGLPDDARPLTYDVTKDDKKATVQQDLSTNCEMKYDVSLK
jgi:hypothetical protein